MHGWTLPGLVALEQPNLLGEPQTHTAMSFGASIDLARGRISADKRALLHQRMAALARRMKAAETLWTDRLADPRSGTLAKPEDNPGLPAGYTYMLQFMAHDMVDSGLSPTAAGAVANGRVRPLMLDALYGLGPDAMPWAYDVEPAGPGDPFVTEHGRMPRNLLRTSICADGAAPAAASLCPFHDIARSGHPLLSDPMIADPRNDAHPLMSQMTALFHLAHNALMRVIAEADLSDDAAGVEVAYRSFACARAILTLIYRRILRADVLRRILHPVVWAAYAGPRRGTPLAPYGGIPVEFSRGAFRFAHALVRDRYVFNDFSELAPASNFLLFSSRRRPEDMPLNRTWMVDWSLFFDVREGQATGTVRNLSRRIGPHYGDLLEDSSAFKIFSALDVSGLAHRDLLSALYAGQWSVAALVAQLRKLAEMADSGLQELVIPDHDGVWQPLIARWLAADPDNAAFAGPVLDAGMIAAIAADPPWPFFVAFEAAFSGRADNLSTVGMGQHLGPIGSLVVAETCFGALQARELVADEWTLSLKQAIGAAMKLYLGRSDLLPELTGPAARPPEDMAGLLKLLLELNAFAPRP